MIKTLSLRKYYLYMSNYYMKSKEVFSTIQFSRRVLVEES